MSEATKPKLATADEAESFIRLMLKECVEGASDRESEALAIAEQWGIAPSWVKEGFASARQGAAEAREAEREEAREEARREAEEAKRDQKFFYNETQLPVGSEVAKQPPGKLLRRKLPSPKSYAELKAEIEAKAEPEAQPKPLVRPQPGPRPTVRSWAEVVIPAGASELERLAHVPGVVGDATEWILQGAKRPNRMMAMAVSLGSVGTLVGRYVEGPEGSATHLFIMNIAGSAVGKGHPTRASKALMESVSAAALIGPGELASAPGSWEHLAANPLQIWHMDEFGNELRKITTQENNVFVSALNGVLKKLYNAWETHTGAAKVGKTPLTVVCPAVTIIATATPEAFFSAITPDDLESGFFNRLLILPWGLRRVAEQKVPRGADVPPKELVEGLRRLPRQKDHSVLDHTAAGVATAPKRMPLAWGPGAEEIYFGFSREVDGWEETNLERWKAALRACENAERLATIVAVGRYSPTVDIEDVRWAIALVRKSVETAQDGLVKYMAKYLPHHRLCEAILDLLRVSGGWCSNRDLRRKFRSPSSRGGYDLDIAIKQLKEEERIEARLGGKSGNSTGWQLLVDE